MITLLAHFGHIYSGAERLQFGWVDAILAGLGGSAVAMFVWWLADPAGVSASGCASVPE